MRGRHYWLAGATLLLMAACGDDDAGDPRAACDENGPRLVASGRVGPTGLSLAATDPFAAGAGPTFITMPLQGGASPHVLTLTSNTVLDADLIDVLAERLSAGGGQLNLATRPADEACDPRDGTLCAAFGLDGNGDGIVGGIGEVVYPVVTGDLFVLAVTGNVIVGDYAIDFGPVASGEEEGGEEGGELSGCFFYFRVGDSLF